MVDGVVVDGVVVDPMGSSTGAVFVSAAFVFEDFEERRKKRRK